MKIKQRIGQTIALLLCIAVIMALIGLIVQIGRWIAGDC